MAEANTRPVWRKTLFSGVLGAAAGGLGMIAVLELGGEATLEAIGLSGVLAAMVGVIYAVTGIGVGFGAAFPALGVRFLNLEDIDEMREQRRILLHSAAGMAATGIALVLLAFSGAAGALPAGPVLAVVAALFVATAWLSAAVWGLMDELMRGMSQRSGSLTFYLLTVFGGGWALLAHLGFVAGPAPLDWLTMIAGLMLVATTIVASRSGLLKPR